MCWRCPASRGARRARSVPPEFPEQVDWYALALDDPREKLEDYVQDAADRRAENEAARRRPDRRDRGGARRSMPPESRLRTRIRPACPDTEQPRASTARRRRRRRSGSLPRRSSWRRRSSSSTVRTQTWKRGRRRWRATTAGRRPRIAPSSGACSHRLVRGAPVGRAHRRRATPTRSSGPRCPRPASSCGSGKRFHRTMLSAGSWRSRVGRSWSGLSRERRSSDDPTFDAEWWIPLAWIAWASSRRRCSC